MACRPLSKTKRYRLLSIDKKAIDSVAANSIENLLEEKEGLKEEAAEEVKE